MSENRDIATQTNMTKPPKATALSATTRETSLFSLSSTSDLPPPKLPPPPSRLLSSSGPRLARSLSRVFTNVPSDRPSLSQSQMDVVEYFAHLACLQPPSTAALVQDYGHLQTALQVLLSVSWNGTEERTNTPGHLNRNNHQSVLIRRGRLWTRLQIAFLSISLGCLQTSATDEPEDDWNGSDTEGLTRPAHRIPAREWQALEQEFRAVRQTCLQPTANMLLENPTTTTTTTTTTNRNHTNLEEKTQDGDAVHEHAMFQAEFRHVVQLLQVQRVLATFRQRLQDIMRQSFQSTTSHDPPAMPPSRLGEETDVPLGRGGDERASLEQAVHEYRSALFRIFSSEGNTTARNRGLPSSLTQFLKQLDGMDPQPQGLYDDALAVSLGASTTYSFATLQQKSRDLLLKWSERILTIPTFVQLGYGGVRAPLVAMDDEDHDQDDVSSYGMDDEEENDLETNGMPDETTAVAVATHSRSPHKGGEADPTTSRLSTSTQRRPRGSNEKSLSRIRTTTKKAKTMPRMSSPNASSSLQAPDPPPSDHRTNPDSAVDAESTTPSTSKRENAHSEILSQEEEQETRLRRISFRTNNSVSSPSSTNKRRVGFFRPEPDGAHFHSDSQYPEQFLKDMSNNNTSRTDGEEPPDQIGESKDRNGEKEDEEGQHNDKDEEDDSDLLRRQEKAWEEEDAKERYMKQVQGQKQHQLKQSSVETSKTPSTSNQSQTETKDEDANGAQKDNFVRQHLPRKAPRSHPKSQREPSSIPLKQSGNALRSSMVTSLAAAAEVAAAAVPELTSEAEAKRAAAERTASMSATSEMDENVTMPSRFNDDNEEEKDDVLNETSPTGRRNAPSETTKRNSDKPPPIAAVAIKEEEYSPQGDKRRRDESTVQTADGPAPKLSRTEVNRTINASAAPILNLPRPPPSRSSFRLMIEDVEDDEIVDPASQNVGGSSQRARVNLPGHGPHAAPAPLSTQKYEDEIWKDPVSVRSAPRRRNAWTADESEAVYEGYMRFGPKWRMIKDNCDNRLCRRTNVQVKDRFRTMVNRGEIKLPPDMVSSYKAAMASSSC